MYLRLHSRRFFCSGVAAALTLPGVARSQTASSRPNVAAIDHTRIFAAADRCLAVAPLPLPGVPAPRSPGRAQDYFSDAQDASPAAVPFTAHRIALFHLSERVAALAAAHTLAPKDAEYRYAKHAAAHLRAWFVDPATSMTPNLAFAQSLVKAGTTLPSGSPEGLVEAVPLAELAHAIPFLLPSGCITPADLAAIRNWFAAYLKWLTESRLAGLARDHKDHHSSSWLFQAACIALFLGNESVLSALRHRFKSVTLRDQIVAAGTFPHELSTQNPLRNSLFNLDLLAGTCQVLSTRFDNLWEVELQDGPGLRSAVAFHFPAISNRGAWPYPADLTHFADLPARRSSLLFAARAYTRPEYAALWSSLMPDPLVPEILWTVPIRQPLLWTTQPKTAA